MKNILIWKYKAIEINKENKSENAYVDYDTLTMKERTKKNFFDETNGELKFQFMFKDPLNEENSSSGKWFGIENELFKKLLVD